MRKIIFLAAASACVLAVEAKVSLAPVFGDRMVLQRDKPVRVWGTADAGEAVMVTYAGPTTVRKACTKAGADGRWLLELSPMGATKEGGVLKANDVEVKDVLVGEVWFCAGQSNTDCPVWGGSPRYRDGQGAMHIAMTVKPWVRLVKTPLTMATEPKLDVKPVWTPMTPQDLDYAKGVRMPSAMGYFYALELANALDIPIGLVDSSWGGTNIDAWTPRCGYEGIKGLEAERDWKMVAQNAWKGEMCKGPIGGAIQQPSALWYGMVAAYTPMSIRGFIWYQGCHNAGEWQRYADKMHALYNGWAKAFRNPDLKLYFVQLAPWGAPIIPYIQEAQAKFDREEKNAGMAVINDVGNLTDIHPNDKRTVAKRLALHALKRDYGYTWLVDNSPTLKSWKVDGDKFVLSFNDAKGWYIYNPKMGDPSVGFEIAGADGKWVPAKLVNIQMTPHWRTKQPEFKGNVSGADLIVAADGVKEPKKLRYLYSTPWFGGLYNEMNLPLGAFHIGD